MDSNLTWTIIARRMDFLYKLLKIEVLEMHFNNKYKAIKHTSDNKNTSWYYLWRFRRKQETFKIVVCQEYDYKTTRLNDI